MPSFFFHLALDTSYEPETHRLALPSNLSPHNDWRYDKIFMQTVDMVEVGEQCRTREKPNNTSNSIQAGSGGYAVKGNFEPTVSLEGELGWGIVRLYRDAEETAGLYDDVTPSKASKHGPKSSRHTQSSNEITFADEDCTTLCILAVPSYLTPSDFLGFVGEKTREEVSHFRMVRTERSNRYMVLMRFRNGKKARKWRKEWNGRVFDSMEPETCHVVFIKSIEFRVPAIDDQKNIFPDMTNDPFTPSIISTASASIPTAKPKAPPTPALIELPTCPVCLERMDESTGLLTILCQHVFHCSCLQKWKGSGCPVCRYTQEGPIKRSHSMGEESSMNECTICRSDQNLWMCIICGNTGCGRYDAAHAFLHYEQTSHCLAMDLASQRVWDYARDGYVHRIVQNQSDGKLVELPSAQGYIVDYEYGHDDLVPCGKLDNVNLEYTHLLTSQLDSQRMYFEEKVERAADKASQASNAADRAAEAAMKATQQLIALQLAHDTLTKNVIPSLEKDKERAQRRADKFEKRTQELEKEWRQEKAMSENLMAKVEKIGKGDEALKIENAAFRAKLADLEELNADLSVHLRAQEQFSSQGEDVREGSVVIVDNSKKKKGGGKSKK